MQAALLLVVPSQGVGLNRLCWLAAKVCNFQLWACVAFCSNNSFIGAHGAHWHALLCCPQMPLWNMALVMMLNKKISRNCSRCGAFLHSHASASAQGMRTVHACRPYICELVQIVRMTAGSLHLRLRNACRWQAASHAARLRRLCPRTCKPCCPRSLTSCCRKCQTNATNQVCSNRFVIDWGSAESKTASPVPAQPSPCFSSNEGCVEGCRLRSQ